MLKLTLLDLDAQKLLGKLADAGQNLTPLMKSIGEGLQESTKQRFATGTGPDGARWAPNSPVTIARFLTKQSGNFKKDGKLSKRGAARAGNKKPLIGLGRALSTQINFKASAKGIEVGSPQEYANVQQEGAKARSFAGGKSPWGDIPARPFLGLSQGDQDLIQDATLDYLESLI